MPHSPLVMWLVSPSWPHSDMLMSML
ncbi:hypothetical protein EYF80_065058 [Liparis tanakae]|uniref:Uncharacterized protein n=1 Tax=Liparis tanakae TaxID=230148 RepID=A0A4Z2E7A7_9TELE|nr:hypothetical protein EYF80_065058 [Liparis tanakae]